MGGGTVEHIMFAMDRPEPKGSVDSLRSQYPNVTFSWYQGPGQLGVIPKDALQGVTGIVTLGLLPAKLSDAPYLKWLQLMSAGADHIKSHPIFTDSKIPITTANGVHGPQIAEWVVMTNLVQTHSYNRLHDLQKEKNWVSNHEIPWPVDYVGQRVGILGYGSIGRQVARVSKAMGMDVLAYTASPRKTPDSRKDNGYIVPSTGDPDGSIPSAWFSGLDKDSLHDFLSQNLDILVLTLPLTKETTHLLSTEEFDLLASKSKGRQPPLLSNISRGKIVDTDALIAALKDDKLRGANLDVTDPEPLPKEHPLWNARNVIITPHVSGMTEKYFERVVQLVNLNLGKLLNGENLVNEVNRKRGY